MNHITLPIKKMKFEEIENSDLAKVKLYVMHDKENLNDVYFDEKYIDKAKNTIVNKPIIAAFEKDENDNAKDFKGHEVEYKILDENGKITCKEIYIEQPIGVIPESNNYRIEEIDNEKWVVVDGYIFKTYCNDAVELLNESDKRVSMEIDVFESEEKDGMTHIKDYKYLGVTVLGKKHNPAMGDNAKISLYSQQNNKFTFALEKIINEVNKITQRKGDLIMPKDNSKKAFSKENKIGEIFIHGVINDDNFWGDEITPEDIQKQLDELKDCKEINVYINSPGGKVFAGFTICNMFRRHSAKINIFIDGLAASIASVIAMGGDTINMYDNSMFMIHNPLIGLNWGGNANELRKQAEGLDKIGESIINCYLSNKTEDTTKEEIIKLMDEETWLTVEDTQKIFKNINLIENTKKEFSYDKLLTKSSFEILKQFKNLPKNILEKVNKFEENNKKEDSKDNSNIDNKEKVINYKKEYQDLIDKFNTVENLNKKLNEKINKLENTNKELMKFKNSKEEEERKQTIENITSKFELTDDEIKTIKNKAIKNEITLELYEEKLYAITGKKFKNKYSTLISENENKDLESKLFIKQDEENNCPYPSLSQYFNK